MNELGFSTSWEIRILGEEFQLVILRRKSLDEDISEFQQENLKKSMKDLLREGLHKEKRHQVPKSDDFWFKSKRTSKIVVMNGAKTHGNDVDR